MKVLLQTNIAFISKSADAPEDKNGTKYEYENEIYKISNQASELSKDDIKHIVEWMAKNDIDTVFVTYFASNFHDLKYGRGMESLKGLIKGMTISRDITKWNQDNIRLLMFITANNQANISRTRYDALDKFKSYLYEVPSNVKDSKKVLMQIMVDYQG